MNGYGTKWRRNITENFNRLSRAHERYRRQTDGRATAYSERSLKNERRCTICIHLLFWNLGSLQFPPIYSAALAKTVFLTPFSTHHGYAELQQQWVAVQRSNSLDRAHCWFLTNVITQIAIRQTTATRNRRATRAAQTLGLRAYAVGRGTRIRTRTKDKTR